MLEIVFQLPLTFRTWVIEYIQVLMLSLSDSLAVTLDTTDNDPDLIIAWAEGLSNDLLVDTDELLAFLSDESFGIQAQALTIPAAEGILRAASALRLKIQQNLLKRLPEEALEEDAIEGAQLSIDEKHAYQCYLFLAALQIAILEALDPALKDL